MSVRQTSLFPHDPSTSEERHTRRWYKENYGVDPLKLGLPYHEAKNPYYSTASPMKLWMEKEVYPFRSEEGIRKFKERSERAKKAFEDRKTRLKEWFTESKSANPRVQDILRELWEIGGKITELHNLKEQCRNDDPDYDSSLYWDMGIEHCEQCQNWTKQQNELRRKREQLFNELETLTKSDKRTIQLARRYLREEQQ